MSVNPASIDVAFIDKCSTLPQEILDEVPPALKKFLGRPDDHKALMAFKRQRVKEIRKIVQSVWPCSELPPILFCQITAAYLFQKSLES